MNRRLCALWRLLLGFAGIGDICAYQETSEMMMERNVNVKHFTTVKESENSCMALVSGFVTVSAKYWFS